MINLEEIIKSGRRTHDFYDYSYFAFNVSYYEEHDGKFLICAGEFVDLYFKKLNIYPKFPYSDIFSITGEQLLELDLIIRKYLILI